MNYRLEESGSHVTIWDDKNKIGLRFKKGESMQRYTSDVIVKNTELLTKEKGFIKVNDISAELRKFAETIYPHEFAPLKEGMDKVGNYPIFKECTDEIIRYLTKEDVCETLLDEIAHDNVVRIEQRKDGSLSYTIKESQYSHFTVQPEMGIKKGFLGYFTPKLSDLEYYNNNKELLAAQYAVNIATKYDEINHVYISIFDTRWESTTKELADRSITLIFDNKEYTYHFRRIWMQ